MGRFNIIGNTAKQSTRSRHSQLEGRERLFNVVQCLAVRCPWTKEIKVRYTKLGANLSLIASLNSLFFALLEAFKYVRLVI